jgi:hypothetical protein
MDNPIYMSMGSQLKDFWVGTYFRNTLLLGHPYLTLFLRVLGKKGEGAPLNDTTLCQHLMLCFKCLSFSHFFISEFHKDLNKFPRCPYEAVMVHNSTRYITHSL